MPMMGLVDKGGARVPWDDLALGDFDDPVPVLRLLYGDREIEPGVYSATEILNDDLQVWLRRRTEYYGTVEQCYDMLLGTGIHAAIQRTTASGDDRLIEREMRLPLGVHNGRAITLRGTPDLMIRSERTIWDYKTVTHAAATRMVGGTGGDDKLQKYFKQVKVYRFMARETMGLDMTMARVRLIIRDFRFSEWRKSPRSYERAHTVTGEMAGDDSAWITAAARGKSDLEGKEQSEIPHCDTWGGIRCEHYCAVRGNCEWYASTHMDGPTRKTSKLDENGQPF